ncbi:hypothetical protein Hanom_Chr05g00387161 [Helianthus anomalus]
MHHLCVCKFTLSLQRKGVWVDAARLVGKPFAAVNVPHTWKVGMRKMDPVTVPNRYRYRIYRTGYHFGTHSVPTFDIFGTGSVPVRYGTGIYWFLPSNTGTVPVRNRYRYPTGTGTEPYHTGYLRYRYRYPLLRIFGNSTFGSGTGSVPDDTELIPSGRSVW